MASDSITKLNPDGTNFLIWKKTLDSVLESKKVAYVLNETTNMSIVDELRCRDLIFGSIDKDLFVMYQNRKTAKSLMDALTGHFKPTNSHRIGLYKQYFNRQMAVDCSIGRHIAQMGAAAAALEAEGVELSETVKAMTLIDSLPNSWRDAVLARTDLEEHLTVEVVIQRLRSVGDIRALGGNSKSNADTKTRSVGDIRALGGNSKSNSDTKTRDIQMMVLIGGYLVFLWYATSKLR